MNTETATSTVHPSYINSSMLYLSTYYVPGTMLSSVYALFNFTLIVTLWIKNSLYTLSVEEETGPQLG